MGKQKKDDEFDFAAELAQATEPAELPDGEFVDEAAQAGEPPIDEEDFDEEETETYSEEDEEPGYAPDPKVSARRWIKAINVLQKGILRRMYKKKILNEGDDEKVRKWKRDHQINPNARIEDVLEGDAETFDRVDRFMKAVEELPFTEDDINDMAEPLSEVIQKYKRLQMSPELALVISVMIVMLPRIEPVMPGFTRIFRRAANV